MITEDFVSFETAKLLKEKGFDAKCRYVYLDTGMRVASQIFMEGESYVNNDDIESVAKHNDWITYTQGDYAFLCPTIHTAMKWLREVHNYDISICLDSYVEPYDNQYYIVIRRRKDKYENISPCEQVYFDTYEQACEAAIKYCLENLI